MTDKKHPGRNVPPTKTGGGEKPGQNPPKQ